MTANPKARGLQNSTRIHAPILLLLFLAFPLFLSEQAADAVRDSLAFSVSVVLPSLFPSMLLSDLAPYAASPEGLPRLSALFERIFKINRAGLSAFLSGLLFGFPLGVRHAAELYRTKQISKDECERLIGFSNNPGPAFLISGVGIGLFGDVRVGALLLFANVVAAVSVGAIFSRKHSKTEFADVTFGQKYDFVESVKRAGVSSVAILATLAAFSVLLSFAESFGNAVLGISNSALVFAPILEIGAAAKAIAAAKLSPVPRLSLLGFSVGFSGFSVHVQALGFLSDLGIDTRRYFAMKALQGTVCALLSACLALLTY